MIESLGRTVLLVRDYDEALAFYRDVLGFEVLHDSTTAEGERFLHVGVPGQPGEPSPGLWFIEAESNVQKEEVGYQTAGYPMFVAYTADCSATVAVLESRGATIAKPPVTESGATFAHFLDLYGNEFVLVELGADPDAPEPRFP